MCERREPPGPLEPRPPTMERDVWGGGERTPLVRSRRTSLSSADRPPRARGRSWPRVGAHSWTVRRPLRTPVIVEEHLQFDCALETLALLLLALYAQPRSTPRAIRWRPRRSPSPACAGRRATQGSPKAPCRPRQPHARPRRARRVAAAPPRWPPRRRRRPRRAAFRAAPPPPQGTGTPRRTVVGHVGSSRSSSSSSRRPARPPPRRRGRPAATACAFARGESLLGLPVFLGRLGVRGSSSASLRGGRLDALDELAVRIQRVAVGDLGERRGNDGRPAAGVGTPFGAGQLGPRWRPRRGVGGGGEGVWGSHVGSLRRGRAAAVLAAWVAFAVGAGRVGGRLVRHRVEVTLDRRRSDRQPLGDLRDAEPARTQLDDRLSAFG